MRDRPAAPNRVTKQKRNGSRRASTKAKSLASTLSKRARKDKSEVNDSIVSADSSIASEIDDEISALDQSKPSKSTRGRPKASKKKNSIDGSATEQATILNDGSGEEEIGSKGQEPDEGDLRQQLSELKRSYSKLETRHRDLQELGVKKAEQNYELLKAQADENTRGKIPCRTHERGDAEY